MKQCTMSRFVRAISVSVTLGAFVAVVLARRRAAANRTDPMDRQAIHTRGSERRLRRLAGDSLGVLRGGDFKAVVCADVPHWVAR